MKKKGADVKPNHFLIASNKNNFNLINYRMSRNNISSEREDNNRNLLKINNTIIKLLL
jgi:hypothetical protein